LIRVREQIAVSADKDRVRGEMDRSGEILRWARQLRKEIPIEDVVDRVRSRLQNAEGHDQFMLELELLSSRR
jgi:hypothetical protein